MARMRRFLGRRVLSACVALLVAFIAWRTLDRASLDTPTDATTGAVTGTPDGSTNEVSRDSPTTNVDVTDDAAVPTDDIDAATPEARLESLSVGATQPSAGAIPANLLPMFERNGGLAEFHARLSAEAEDPLWAAQVETKINDFLSQLDHTRFNVLSVECRSTMCEILAEGFGAGSDKEWLRAFTPLFESDVPEEWFGGDGLASCGWADLGTDVFGLSCTFAQASPDAAPEDSGARFSLDAPHEPGVQAQAVAVDELLADLIETDQSLYDLHRELEREVIDYSWSEFIETQLVDYFASRPGIDASNIAGLECRASLCEVQILMPSESQMLDWVGEFGEFMRQPWHELEVAGFDGDSVGEEQGGIVWFLRRRSD
jgi:hypothetical protein